MTGAVRTWLDRFERWGTAAENFLLVLLLVSLMVLAVSEIVLRMFFSVGFVWAGELINLIVLWITIVASVAAARSDRHLRIDAMSHFVSRKYARLPRAIVDTFAAGVCIVLAWHSWRYLQLTIEFDDTVLGDIPAWCAYAVVPAAFLLMAYRFLLAAGRRLLLIVGVLDEPGEQT
ncbi:MAG: TRAP transporter small permease subunit [Gammaproteobacteria bacterium]|nr:TRAP transporter small permease subunit [Gammaproteobacteria bacterium]